MPSQQPAEQKTEKPTPRKRRQAKEQGQVAQSSEVNNALVLLAMVGALALFSGYAVSVLTGEAVLRLGSLARPELTLERAPAVMAASLYVVGRALAPFMLFLGVVALAGSVGQTGLVFTAKKIRPNLDMVNPVKGLRNLLSASALFRLLVSIVKLAIVGGIAYLTLRGSLEDLFGLVRSGPAWILEEGKAVSLALLFRISVAMVAVAVVDYAFQRWRHEKELRMTRTEAREERKREEGSPEVKARLNQMRSDLARARMMHEVPESNVVVTNPTHIAVALKWDESTMAAPRVVAKGRDYLAERIKQVAEAHGVPVVERKPLAQSLYAAVDLGMEIPAQLYYAVAEVLAFVMKRRKTT